MSKVAARFGRVTDVSTGAAVWLNPDYVVAVFTPRSGEYVPDVGSTIAVSTGLEIAAREQPEQVIALLRSCGDLA